MDTMYFYFEIDDIRCRKHANPKKREKDKEKSANENIHSKFNNEGEKDE